jgi:WD40 repeat protein
MSGQRLEYASANLTRKPWGPFFVRPSRRSVVLLVLAFATAAWLGARHRPWTLTARVQSWGEPYFLSRFEFTPTNRLLICHRTAYVWDADHGRMLHQIGKPESVRLYPPLTFNHATEILFVHLGFGSASALLYDLESGALVKEVALTREGMGDRQLIAAAPTGHRLLIRRDGLAVAPSRTLTIGTLSLWDLDAPASAEKPLEPMGTLPLNGWARFSPDGGRIAVFEPPSNGVSDDFRDPYSGGFGVFDSATRTPFFINRDRANGQRFGVFSSDGSRIISFADANQNTVMGVVNAATGEPLRWFTIGTHVDRQISPDGEQAAIVGLNSANKYELSILDVKTGPGSARRVLDYRNAPLTFFRDGRRLLTSGPEYRSLAVYDVASLKPLAILRSQAQELTHLAISPDASHLAAYAYDNTIAFYRKTGPDCPESAWGALAFPHVWLLIALVTAAAFSLRRDADHASSDLTLPVARFALVLFLIALPRTLHVLVATCIGEGFLTPAPLILLAAIGLATGGRFWRLVTLTILAAAFPLDLYCLYLLKHAGLGERSSTLMFDRNYAVPHLAVFMALVVFTALIPAGIYVLSRRPR